MDGWKEMDGAIDIVYVWTNSLRGFENNRGIPLSGKYVVEYNQEQGYLNVRYNENYLSRFWGESVHDCFAVVGENGSGKTMLMNYIMENIQKIKTNCIPQSSFIMIFENDKNKELLVYVTTDLQKIIVESEEIKCKKVLCNQSPFNELSGFEIAYFHNSISYADYYCDTRCSYDFSLGKMIHNHQDITSGMHYDALEKDVLNNYFDNEAFRIIEFIYHYGMNNKLQIPFPIPREITIEIADVRFNEEYILNRAKGIRVDKNGEGDLSAKVDEFRCAADNIVEVFGKTWITCTIKNLLWNCFKELCIPQKVPSRILEESLYFFEACKTLKNKHKPSGKSIYAVILEVIDKLDKKSESVYNNCLNNTRQFIQWLQKNEENIVEYNNDGGIPRLLIKTEKNTEEFMEQLIDLYSKMNFTFPFYKFSFGVSTGEYNFLSVFSNLFSMRESSKWGINAYNYSVLDRSKHSILLIFDEADLAMHPRWQRMYMKWMIEYCEQLFYDLHVKIVIATHSPIMLSDFPAHSVLYLKRGKEEKTVSYISENNTFGCNIHLLFLNSFFLNQEGTMGAFAENKIDEIAALLLSGKETLQCRDEIKKAVEYIGEGIIKKKLEEVLERREVHYETPKRDSYGDKIICETLLKLKGQRKMLDQIIKQLEDGLYDTN